MEKAGFALIALGVAVVLGYGGVAFFTATDVPLWLRATVGVIVLGLLMLLVSAGRERYKSAREEHFREVKR
jgi:membrane protein implicated in regulation of membrane protease activity